MWVGVPYPSCSLQTGAATGAGSAHCRGYLLSNVVRVLALSPYREGLKVSGCRIDRNDLGLVFGVSFRERRARRKALAGQITADERIDRSGPPGLASVSQEIADRQPPRLLPQRCDIGQAAAARPRRRQVRHDRPPDRGPLAAPSLSRT